MTQFTLLKNQKRTHDVHELVFRMSPNALSKPGSFILFALPSGLKRAYSIAFHEADTIGFLVKSIANGKGGSRELCGLSE
jgi:NAD(P)H-flavin reductase